MSGRIKVHIAMVGRTIENVTNGIFRLGADELYPIISEKFKAGSEEDSYRKLKEAFEPFHVVFHPLVDPKSLVIDPFNDDSYQELIGLIIDIVNKRKKDAGVKGQEIEFWVNITGGTNLMSAAASAGAILTRSNAYYVLERGKGGGDAVIISLPWHSAELTGLSKRCRDILKIMSDGDGLSDTKITMELRKRDENISNRMTRYALDQLDRGGYVKRERDGKENNNSLTNWGKIAGKLLG